MRQVPRDQAGKFFDDADLFGRDPLVRLRLDPHRGSPRGACRHGYAGRIVEKHRRAEDLTDKTCQLRACQVGGLATTRGLGDRQVPG